MGQRHALMCVSGCGQQLIVVPVQCQSLQTSKHNHNHMFMGVLGVLIMDLQVSDGYSQPVQDRLLPALTTWNSKNASCESRHDSQTAMVHPNQGALLRSAWCSKIIQTEALRRALLQKCVRGRPAAVMKPAPEAAGQKRLFPVQAEL